MRFVSHLSCLIFKKMRTGEHTLKRTDNIRTKRPLLTVIVTVLHAHILDIGASVPLMW